MPRLKMIDINYILNGTRKPVKKAKNHSFGFFSPQKKGKDPLANLMLKPSKGSIIGDRITKPQRIAMKRNPFTDWDKDGVINGLDCQPRNPKKHMAFKNETGVPIVDHPKDYGYSSRKVMMTPKMFMREARASNNAFDMTDDEYEIDTVTRYKYPKYRDEAVKSGKSDAKQLDKYIAYKTNYMNKLKESIEDDEPKVPPGYIEYDERGMPKEHEGRHRAIAARDAGMKEIPVYILNKETDDEGNPKTYYGKVPKDSNNWDD